MNIEQNLHLEGAHAQQMLQVSRDWGCATTTLHCSPANIPARRLYHKAGYVEQQQGSRQGGLLPGWCQLAHPLQLLAKPL